MTLADARLVFVESSPVSSQAPSSCALTPAEATGITVEGANKWETVIRYAAVGLQPEDLP